MKYNNVEEITKAFIKKGWKDPKFREMTEDEDGCLAVADGLKEGKKFFRMLSTGNVYDEHGEVFYFNIPVKKPAVIPFRTPFRLYYQYPRCTIFDLDDIDFLGVTDDDEIQIGVVESDMYGTSKACEGYTGYIVEEEVDIDFFFKDVCDVEDSNRQSVEKEEFINMVKAKYRALLLEIENNL